MLLGSFINPKDPIYRKSEKDFKKNLLVIDFEKYLKNKKTKLKDFLKIIKNGNI